MGRRLRRVPVTWKRLCELGGELPEVTVDVWYGTPALKVRGKGFVRLKEDGQTVVFLLENLEEQEMLIENHPRIYFITDHYRGWPTVLARMPALGAGEARVRLERAWRTKAPPKLIRAFDGEPPAAGGKRPPTTAGPKTRSPRPTARAPRPRIRKPNKR